MKKNSKIKFRPSSLDTTKSIARELFEQYPEPHDAIMNLSQFIYKKGVSLPFGEYDEVAENIWIHKSAYLASNVKIDAPAIICGGAKICHGAHIKSSIIGSFAHIGDNCEVISSIVFDKSRLVYSNIVCASVVGHGARLSSGACICEDIASAAVKRTGAVICDFASVGANSVIGSGIIVDEYSTIPPLSAVLHDVKAFSVFKK